MKIKKLFMLAFLYSCFTYGQHKFSDLKYIDINNSFLNGKFGYPNTNKFNLVNKLCEDIEGCYDYGDPLTFIGTWTKNSTKIDFYYTEAPSDDPFFVVVIDGKPVIEESGTTLHFKGSIVYIEGIANAYFNVKRKFQLNNNTFSEVKQPFYHIGIKGKLNFPIKLFATQGLKNKIASLPKGYEIEILLGLFGKNNYDLEKILIKSKFGLVGWCVILKIFLLQID